MKKTLENILLTWPKSTIRDVDFEILLPGTANSRYSIIKRAVKTEKMTRLKKGLYLINKPFQKVTPNLFEMAQLLYGPSYISLASALSYHQWIPEATYRITSVSIKRSTEFKTTLARFSFQAIPKKLFYLGVERIETNGAIFLLASPWKALADYLYMSKKILRTFHDLESDLRIETNSLLTSDRDLLVELTKHYPNAKVRKCLKSIHKEFNSMSKTIFENRLLFKF